MITLPYDLLHGHETWQGAIPLQLRSQDDGDSYSGFNVKTRDVVVRGSLFIGKTDTMPPVADIAHADDEVCVIATPPTASSLDGGNDAAPPWVLKGFARRHRGWVEMPVAVVPLQEDLFSPTKGLIETDALADKQVLVVGLGSGGGPVAIDLARLGLNLILIDHDRLEVHNVVRHVAGLSDVGRLKVNILAEKVLEKNPFAKVDRHATKIGWDTVPLVRQLVRKSDLVVCAVDCHDGRQMLNKVCCEERKPLIIAGAFRRAHGGQVLVVIPGRTPCFQCFLKGDPTRVRDREISSAAQARRYAYSDRPVAIEPGLSVDIAPISLMIVKLAIQLMLKGKPTSLQSLDADLVAPWFMYLNRREKGTSYEGIEPLGFEVDGFHILRWYGIDYPRDPACPCCGDFVESVAAQEGIQIDPEDAAKYVPQGG